MQKFLDILQAQGVNALAEACIKAGMDKQETLEQYRQAVINFETKEGRESGSYYVLADAYDKQASKRNIHTLYIQYRRKRAKGMPHYFVTAKDALQAIRAKDKRVAMLDAIGASHTLYTDYKGVAHEWEENGFTIQLKIENDENHVFEDIIPYKGGMNSQGYYVYDLGRYADEDDKQDKRYSGGAMILAQDIGEGERNWKKFELPESYVKQFYNNKDFGKHEAYSRMVASAKIAVDQDIKIAKMDYCYVSVTVLDKHGNEIFHDGLGGCDYDYAQSGEAFFDHGMIDSARDAINSELEEKAETLMASRPDLYSSAGV